MSIINLDRSRIRDLFDLRRHGSNRFSSYTEDPYPAFQRLRETGPVHEGKLHELVGFEGPAYFHGTYEPDRKHISVFSYEECHAVYRNQEAFRSAPTDIPRPSTGANASMFTMDGAEHRRYRALVQGSFVPGKSKWWIENWIDETVHALIDGFEADGRADLNVDYHAVIPLLTITSSFGLSPDEALDVRETVDSGGQKGRPLEEFLAPIIAVRRDNPQDDLISVLCQAEIADEDGSKQRLSDSDIIRFAHLLLAAGSGTTWKQMGIMLVALLRDPPMLEAVRQDRSLLRAVADEALRWNATDPAFGRWAIEDTTLAGVKIPKHAVVQVCLGAANRDPSRWHNPDEFDIYRPLQPALGFAHGPHTCLGQHVARAEMMTALNALLDRLPNLRLDPDAEPPAIIGLYERGPTHIPVLWG